MWNNFTFLFSNGTTVINRRFYISTFLIVLKNVPSIAFINHNNHYKSVDTQFPLDSRSPIRWPEQCRLA
jgi:hypothetical protein